MWGKVFFLFCLTTGQGMAQSFGGLVFIENKNQWEQSVDFQAKSSDGIINVSANGFSVYLIDQAKLEQDHLGNHQYVNESDGEPPHEPTNGHYFQINFLGSNPDAKPVGLETSPGYYNYFLGNDSCRWASNVNGYMEIIYANIYSGIDLRISSLGRNLKYDFIVKAGADPNQIRIQYCGVDRMDQLNGDIHIQTSLGTMVEKKPVSYQQLNSTQKSIASEYKLEGDELLFLFPAGYDPCYDLVIDPLLIFSTYSGSTADNWGSTATPGEHGTLYSSGVTNEQFGGAFPATVGAFQVKYGGNYDIAILKYDSIGTKFLYATYLGGSLNETPHSLLSDKTTGDLIILGTTSSPDFPTTAIGYDRTFNFGQHVTTPVIPYDFGSDIIITRLNQTGNLLIGSTYVGGNLNDGLNATGGPLTKNYGDEMRGDVITDDQGNIYVSSVTSSDNFPVTPGFGTTYKGGATDAVVFKMSPNLSSIIWSGFLGGFSYDAAYSIKIDKDQNLIVAGGTNSGNFPTTPNVYQSILGGNPDGWIARISADGKTILHSTFTGTTSYDQIYFVDLNEAGEIFCYGQTSGKMPVTANVYKNSNSGQFLQKFSADLSTLKFSTVFGSGIGIPNISPTAFLINECDNIYMSGWGGDINKFQGFWNSSTSGMSVTPDAYQKTTSGSDFYFLVLNGDATQLVYATFLGGTNSKTHVDGGTSRFDKFGIVYHAVCAGCAALNNIGHSTSDFPTTPGVVSRTNNSSNCNNAAFKFDLASLRARFQTNTVKLDKPNINKACFPDPMVFQNMSTAGETFIWDFGDGTIITRTGTDQADVTHQYSEPGAYSVKLKVIDLNTCKAIDSVSKIVQYSINEITVADDAELCEGESLKLIATGGNQYAWRSEDNSFTSNEPSPLVNPDTTTRYYVSVEDLGGCTKEDTVNVKVVANINLIWDYNFAFNCIDKPSIVVRNKTKSEAEIKLWFDFGDGEISDEQETRHTFLKDSLYTVKLFGQRNFCVFEKAMAVPVYTLFTPNVITPTSSPGFNDQLIIRYGEKGHTPADLDLTVGLTIVDRWGKKVFESNDYKNDWDASNIEGGIYFLEMKLGNLTSCKNWLHVIK